MITRLRIKNFKAWKDSGDVRIAPITVLFGTNSAGKTSIPQLLLLLKQTAASSDRSRPLHFGLQAGDQRTLADLGDLRGVLHRHDLRRSLEFELDWTLPKRLHFTDAHSTEKFSARALGFAASIRGEGDPPQPFVQRMTYTLDPGEAASIRVGVDRLKSGKYELNATGYAPVRRLGRKWPLPSPNHFFGFPDEAIAYFQNTSFLADLSLEAARLLEGVNYVGPLRDYPQRLYRWSGETPVHVGSKGEAAVSAILAAGDRQFNLGPRRHYKPLDQLVAELLWRMGLIYDFSVKPVVEGRKEYEVRVQTSEASTEVLLTDVGFGVSQVLPVIVECFYVPAGSVLIFEQPEIHLHPAVQAELADLFVDAIRSRENGVERNVQFIIESHSEHFLRRLQLRIAEGALSQDEAALYFIDTTGGEARLEALDVDKYGNILNWPDKFFGDEMADLVARTQAQVRRMQAEKAPEGS